MSIKASAAAEIRVLVAALSAPDDIRREAAVARLGIIGARAVDRLIEAYNGTGDRPARLAMLRALERIGDDRSLAVARDAIANGGELAVAATGVLRSLLPSRHAETADSALEALVGACVSRENARGLRLAAFEALQEMPADVKARVQAALDADESSGMGDLVAAARGTDMARGEALWKDATEGRLPETPAALREALRPEVDSAPLNTLRALVDAIRSRERDDVAHAAAWVAVRGALHQALALRGSRVALYDLRETIEACPPALPSSFIAALHAIGDASCLEPIAAAWGAAGKDPDGEPWRQQLASAFAAIVAREKISRRHASMKRVAAKWPGLL